MRSSLVVLAAMLANHVMTVAIYPAIFVALVGTLVADRKSDERPITIPKPELLGINEPKESYETVGIAWRPTPVSHERSTERGPRVDLGPAVDDFAADAPVTRKTSSAAPSRQFLDDRSDAAPAPAPKAKAKVVGSWSATPNSRVGVLESVGP